MQRKYDIVIFGASGYTGQYVAEFLLNVSATDEDSEIKWAIAGRDEAKLNLVVLKIYEKMNVLKLNKTFSVPIIVCNINDEDSLNAMVCQTRLVINCVGPYRFYGEPVVSACINNVTHYVDISGEPEFLESMQFRYQDSASTAGVYIIGSCGFDSVPADVGAVRVAQAMGGDVNDIETYLSIILPSSSVASGPCINYATYQSAIYSLASVDDLKKIRRKLYPSRLPVTKPHIIKRSVFHFSQIVGKYCMPFPGADRSVMMRTQRERFFRDNQRPTQISCFVQFSSLFWLLLTAFIGSIFGFMARFKIGRWFLEKFPGFFTLGTVTKLGPSRAMAEGTNFKMTLVGRGWKTVCHEFPKDEHDVKPNREVKVVVSGENIGYGSTSEFVVQAALVILKESDKIPGKGGVLTPGYAFAKTSYIDRLQKRKIPFEIVSVRDDI